MRAHEEGSEVLESMGLARIGTYPLKSSMRGINLKASAKGGMHQQGSARKKVHRKGLARTGTHHKEPARRGTHHMGSVRIGTYQRGLSRRGTQHQESARKRTHHKGSARRSQRRLNNQKTFRRTRLSLVVDRRGWGFMILSMVEKPISVFYYGRLGMSASNVFVSHERWCVTLEAVKQAAMQRIASTAPSSP